MVKNIQNKKITIYVKEEKVNLPEEIQKKIDENWEKIMQEGSNVWNGEVTCVSEINESENEIEMICRKSNYSHYLYGERIGLPVEYSCPNLSAGCLIETIDGYYLVGELDKTTSYPGMLQVPGGNIDKKDIQNEILEINKTILREVTEEINLNLEDENLVKSYEMKYIYIAEEDEQPGIQVFSKAIINMTAKEMEDYYKKYLAYLIENNLEVEFGKIHLLNKENALEELDKLNNSKRNYLRTLIEADCKIMEY